ncbi:MAG: hypothetical protein ABWZ98_16705 [Nakamurella sp.]
MIRDLRVKQPLPLRVQVLIAVTFVVAVAVISSATDSDQPSGVGSAARLDCSGLTGHSNDLAPDQERNAKIITAVAHTRGLGDDAAAIGVSVALAESVLLNTANDGTSDLYDSLEGRQLTFGERAVARKSMNYPHDAVGNNLDSIGLFQQRPMSGWGTPEQLIDPVISTELFFDRLARTADWQDMAPWAAGQAVQGSPDSSGQLYQDTFERAAAVVDEVTAQSGSSWYNDPVCLKTGLRRPVGAAWPPRLGIGS